jgi:antitoxin VapB
MEMAKVFENGRSQAVRLPKKFRFKVDEVIVQQLGDAVLLVPKESLWQTFMDGLNGFTSDIFEVEQLVFLDYLLKQIQHQYL